MTAGGLFLGGPRHAEVWALEHREQIVEVAEHQPLDYRLEAHGSAPTAAVPYKLHHYRRRPITGRYPMRALVYLENRPPLSAWQPELELTVEWDVYARDSDEHLAVTYLALVCFLYWVTGRLETGGSPITVTTMRTGARSFA